MQIHNGHRVLVQTSIFEPDPAALWLEWAKRYGVVVAITVVVAVVAVFSYLQSGRKQKLRQERYVEARQLVHTEEYQCSEEIEESLTDRCGDLKRHLVQLDKKKKKTEEKRLFGINLTDIQTDVVNRDDHDYHCATPDPPEEQRKEGDKEHHKASMLSEVRQPPRFNNARRSQHFSHHQDESTYSSESTFSKSSTLFSKDEGAESRFTKETNVTAKTNFSRRRRASSFRRMSSGDVVDGW